MTGSETLSFYDSHASEIAPRYEHCVPRRLQRRLARVFRGRRQLLELGCGTGRDAAYMHSRGFQVTGLDGSDPMLREAERLHPELKDALTHHVLPSPLDFPGGRFDGVYALASLMHLPRGDLEGMFGEIHRVLRPRGRLLFSVCTDRPGLDEGGREPGGRLFTLLSCTEWVDLYARAGFDERRRWIEKDSAGRPGIRWVCLLLDKR